MRSRVAFCVTFLSFVVGCHSSELYVVDICYFFFFFFFFFFSSLFLSSVSSEAFDS